MTQSKRNLELYNLAIIAPSLAKEWYQQYNGTITPLMVTKGTVNINVSNKKVKPAWKCSQCGYIWRTSIRHRLEGTGCPACAGKIARAGINDLQTLYPEIAAEWNESKNKKPACEILPAIAYIKIDNIKQYPWWQCSKCGYEWQMPVYSRTGQGKQPKQGCPACAGKAPIKGKTDLLTLYPVLCKEWDYNKNGSKKPEEYTKGSHAKIWWHCNACNGSYQMSIDKRTHGKNCPICAGHKIIIGINDLQSQYPNIASEWYQPLNGSITPEMITAGNNMITIKNDNTNVNIKVKPAWKCSKCGFIWRTATKHRTGSTKSGCPKCMSILHKSKQEDEVADYAKTILNKYDYNNAFNHDIIRSCKFNKISDGAIDSKKELDIYIPLLSLAIEYDGDYWHSNELMVRKTGLTNEENHNEKLQYCQQLGITLLFITEHEWLHDNDNMKNMIEKAIMQCITNM